jgi:hypothetical protein
MPADVPPSPLDEPGGGEKEGQDWHRRTRRLGFRQFCRGLRQLGRSAMGMDSQFDEAASRRFNPAQIRQAARQPNSCRNTALNGQPIVLAKPAIRVIQ